MKLFLYNVADGDNVINKTLSNKVEIEIRLSNDVDVINPEIRLRNIAGVDFNDFNYAYIDVLGRYYFINKLGRVSANDTFLYLSCDVLETYKAEILASKARLRRSIRNGDFYEGNMDFTIDTNVMIYNSNAGLPDGENTTILTTIGV